MNKKFLIGVLISLASYAIFVGLVVNFYDDSPSNMQWEDRESFNRLYISKLKLGELQVEQVIEELGSPDIIKAKQVQQINYQVLFYRTQHVKSDGITTQEECSYLVFVNDTLVEFASAENYSGLEAIINTYGAVNS
jgi:alpha-D-ribose 1-methylphosphonate 5-triphosphate diphosphatase PhnM